MSLLSDSEILNLAKKSNMISPYEDKLISSSAKGEKIISYGLSSYGYDSKLSDEFVIISDSKKLKIDEKSDNKLVIDPKNLTFDHKAITKHKGDFCTIPPHGFVLGCTSETFKLPKDVFAVCFGKSTYARCGIIVNVTPIEPEFEGTVVIEFSNTTDFPVKIYANEGCCQFVFFKGNKECSVSYKNRSGKYQNQKGIKLPVV